MSRSVVVGRLVAMSTAGLLCIGLMSSCRRPSKSAITLAGSTSVEPFAERLAELYMAQHRAVAISVQGGGSSAGIKAVQNRICQIGMSSRALTPAETELTEITIALDAIAVVVNRSNPVARLSLEQLRAVFSGRVRNWRELGGENRLITVITREEGSGTRASFEDKVMLAGEHAPQAGAKPVPEPFTGDALVQDSNGAVREIVASDPAAIGYISFGLVDDRIRPLAVDGVMPGDKAIKSGRYPVVRRFLFLICGKPAGEAGNFIDFALSPAGQAALAAEGLTRVD
jgi:phosphate transport system substrate-binding protein